MAFKDLSAEDRLVAVHTDFMRHPDYCILGGVTQVGKVIVTEDVPTAGTDGRDVFYGREFLTGMTRKQARYLVGHEAMHKALHHCTAYAEVMKKYPREFAMAVDYVVNWQLESMDTGADPFLERPTSVPPLVDAKYAHMSVLEVVRDLLNNPPPTPLPQPMDQHMQPGEGAGEEPTEAEMREVTQKIEDAIRHGEIVQGQLRGDADRKANGLSGFQQRKTDWRPPLRRIFQEVSEGDDQSRFCPPSKRMLPLDIIMPSHFTEASGEIIVACDTSGSMTSVYPLVFGEIARIAQSVRPTSIRVIWWDTKVRGEQVFTVRDYDNIAKLMAPKGGGGTTVTCVARHVAQKRLKPKATIMLTDGYIEASYETVPGTLVWGVVCNPRFRPVRGRVLHIEEVG
jgi:predicted metal-dependent peptidase